MEVSIAEKFADLEKRISNQEHLHRDITATPAGIVHGVLNNIPFIIAAIVLAAITAYLVTNSLNKKNVNQS